MQTTPKANNILGHFFALLGAVVMLAIATWVSASGSEQVQPLDNLATPRTGHTATALSDGRILITGGRDSDGNLVAASEIFDPETQTSSANAALHTARVDHSATVLVDGRVLIAGGTGASGALASAEIFDPAHPESGFQMVGSAMSTTRTRHTATLLNDGHVLFAGGDAQGTAELFDPATGTFMPTIWPLTMARSGHTATLFTDDTVLLAGGNTSTMETYTPGSGFTLDPATMSVVRTGHWAFELSDTRLLLFQGDTGNTIDEFNPTAGTITPKGSLDFHASSSSLLANGKVLVLGTDVSGLYNPDATPPAPDFTAFDETSVPHSGILPRSGQSSTQLPGDKKILVAGGANTQNIFQGMALFNPAHIWTDRDDYHPGDPVVLSGSGWKANEDVYLYAVDDETQQWTYGSTETAGADGSFVDSPYFIVLQRQLGATFTVTAVGAQSSMQADVEFTDAASITFTTLTVGAQSGTLTYGTAGSTTYAVTVNRSSNGNASASLSITGLPTGTAGTFSPASVSFSGNNPSATSTLTITTTSLTPAGTPTFTVKATDGNDVTNFVTGTGTLTIGPKHITGSFTAQSKVYDGSTTATVLTRSVSGLVGADVVTLSGGTATFNNKNVGTGKTVTLTGATLSGADASKYVLDSVSITTANITPLSITGSFTANSKQYDGTNSATVAARSLSGLIPPDAVTLTGGTATFNNKNVGTGKTVTLTGASLSGADAGNYALGSVSTTTADITPKNLTISGAVANSKQYDGSATATVNFAGASLVGVISPDVVNINSSGYSASFNNKNVGTAKSVTLTGVGLSGTDAGNYTVTQPSGLTADITAKNLTISGAIADSKQYDGNAIATLDFTGASLVGVILPDVVTINSSGYNATFNNKDVGNSKPVTVTAVTLLGADAGNYTLSQPSGLTANITAKNLTITSATANNKQYDGNNSATVNFAGASLVGVIAFDVVSIDSFGYSATFNNKNVGNGKPVTVTGVTLSGADNGNYTVSQPSGLTANVTAKNLTISGAVAQNKIYDGNTTATVDYTSATLAVVVTGDAVSINSSGSSATFVTKTVGNGKAVTVTGVALSGTDAGNYTVSQPTGLTANITAKHITGSFTAQDKEYDGTNATTVLTRSVSGEISGDDVHLTGGTATFSDKNVGSGKTVTLTGATLNGTDAGNYVLDSVSTTTASITAKRVTGSFTAQDKEYDGNTSATVVTRSLSGTITGDDVHLTGGTATFADKNVGTGKVVTLTGATLNGTDAGNYFLDSVATTVATITAKHITGSFTASDKAYDGNTSATVLTRSLNGVVLGDLVNLTGGTATFADKNIGIGKTVTLTGATLSGIDASNYVLDSVSTTTATITAKHITGSFAAQDKQYDGTNTATVLTRSVSGEIAGDDVHLTGGTATFSDKNVGTNKTVTLTGASLTGTDAGNYVLDSVSTTTSNITAKHITGSFTAQDKEYDGTNAATVLTRSVSGEIAGDDVHLAGGTATFSDKNVGPNKTVTLTGATLTGTDAENYVLDSVSTTTASITAKHITGSFTAQDKEYDGTNAATVLTRSWSGEIAGDDVHLTGGTGTFGDKSVGTHKTVTLTGASLTGTDAGNYVLDSVLTTTANITAKHITGSFTAQDKEYDGTTAATVLTRSVSGEIAGDDVHLTGGTATFSDKNVGTNKTVTLTGATLSGTDAGNYILDSVATTTASITAKHITGNFTAQDKVYDGTTSATVLTRSVSGEIAGDDVHLTGGTASFSDKNVGTNKTVTLTGASLAGTDAGNYVLDSVSTTTANITARDLTVTAVTNTKTYDGTTSAAAVPTYSGLQPGDTVTGVSETYDTKNAGTGKTLSVATYTVNDGNSGNNYSVHTVDDHTGVINQATLTITALTNTKTYDGTTSAAAVPTYSGLQSGDTVTGLTETYDTKNVGTAKPLSVATYTVSDGNSGNNYVVHTVIDHTGVINQATLTITATTNTKPYDSNTSAAATPTVSGLQGTDTVTGLSETYDNKNVGTGKTLSVDVGYVVNDGNSGNNYNVSTVPNNAGVITAVTLTITTVTNTKPYDANTSAAATPTVSGLQGTDTVSGLSETYDNKNVGTGKTLSVASYTVNDGNSGNNYNVTPVPNNSGVITAVTLTITATTNSKPYDANTSAAATQTVSGLQGTDTVSGLNETYDNKNVGTGKTLSVAAGYTVNDGNSGNNYNVSTVPDTTGVITAVNLTITAVTNTKPYDANTSAAATPTVSGLQGTDTVSGLSETYDNKNVGTGKALSVAAGYTVNDGNSGNNYNVSTVPDTTGVITAVNLTITATTNAKPYDSNTSAAATPTVSGLHGTDTVTRLSETYDNKNVGTGKTLSVDVGYVVNDGNSGNNYNVSTTPNNTGVITAVTLTITAVHNSKPYDANTSAAATPTVSGLQGTDTVSGLGETYNNKNVGTGKTLSVASYTVNDGNGGNNYNVSTVPNNTGVITVVNLTITAVTNTKPYDANTSAAATPTVSGLQGTDTVSGLGETYNNKNVGTGKTLSVASYTVNDGNSGNNYNVSTVPNNAGVITAVTLTITAVTNTKTYDCNTTASAIPIVSGLQGTDTVTGKVEAYATANAGTGKTVNVTAYMVNDGNGGNNYNVGTVPNNTGVINKANTTTSVTSSPNPSVIGQIVTFTGTVTPPTPCTPGGSVQFYDGAALLGTGTLNGLNPNSATFSTSSLTAGSHSITATYVGDSNFNPSTSSASTQNVNYTFIGFLPPVDNPPVLNQVKAGQVIPVKWQLKDSSGNLICDLSTLVVMQSISIGCDSHDPIDDIEEVVPPGGTVFRCDGTQFIFNWQTPKSWAGTCRQLQVTLSDGHTYIANFKFK